MHVHALFSPPVAAGAVLTVRDVRVAVKLGATEGERAAPQEVSVHLDVIFRKPPYGCVSDDLKNTLCYDALCKKVESLCADNAFALIERFAFAVYEALKQDVGEANGLVVQAVKISPPVDCMRGGAAFTCGDL
ncbi:MAG: dihydroneopterin aldolase [Rickettsiales bacterium]